MRQVRAGFHHDDRVAGAGDVEAKMAAGDAQRAGLRIPQLRRNTAKRRAPARGAREVIDNDRIRAAAIVVEHVTRVEGRVSQKIGGCEAGAIDKYRVSDAGDAIANRDAGQASTLGKRSVSDDGDAVGQGDAGQPGATGKRTDSEAGDAVGNGGVGQTAAILKRTVSDAG